MFCYIYSPHPPQPSQTKLEAGQDVEAVEAFASVVELDGLFLLKIPTSQRVGLVWTPISCAAIHF